MSPTLDSAAFLTLSKCLGEAFPCAPEVATTKKHVLITETLRVSTCKTNRTLKTTASNSTGLLLIGSYSRIFLQNKNHGERQKLTDVATEKPMLRKNLKLGTFVTTWSKEPWKILHLFNAHVRTSRWINYHFLMRNDLAQGKCWLFIMCVTPRFALQQRTYRRNCKLKRKF